VGLAGGPGHRPGCGLADGERVMEYFLISAGIVLLGFGIMFAFGGWRS
jgi:hypothetical protein